MTSRHDLLVCCKLDGATSARLSSAAEATIHKAKVTECSTLGGPHIHLESVLNKQFSPYSEHYWPKTRTKTEMKSPETACVHVASRTVPL